MTSRICLCGHSAQFHFEGGECRWSAICHCLIFEPDPSREQALRLEIGVPPEMEMGATPVEREPEFDKDAPLKDDRDYSERGFGRAPDAGPWWAEV